MLKERYYATVECIDRYGKANKQFIIHTPFGKLPSIGDYVESFRLQGHEMEIKDFVTMTFRPTDPQNSAIISLRVLRALKDHGFTADQLRSRTI